jgi:DNA helicase-2/ATP-dependent DNA helicase PcrA
MNALDRIVASLNNAQRDAVLHNQGPLLVLAGAGSGKTRVLTTRIARLLAEGHARPAEILSLTFTNKAAGEMRERIEQHTGAAAAGMWSGTFHSIGARMLRRYAHLVGRTPAFTIYDEDDMLSLVKRVMERARVSSAALTPKVVLGAISDAKNALVSPQEYRALAREPMTVAIAGVYAELEVDLERANAVGFDDLLVLPVRALEANPPLQEALQRQFRYLLVDEYQDTNRAQYHLVRLIGGAHGNVMVVGDEDQSIYGWRGADIRNILDFERDFPGAAVVRLEENYRSTPQILAVANAAISSNTERRGKTLRATRPAGETVAVMRTLDERDEADFVLQTILDRTTRGASARSECAVLYRTNAQSRVFEDACRRYSVPYRLVGAVRFYDRREIRDLIAYLKLIANPADDEAFRRAVAVPRRGIGDATLALIDVAARERGRGMFDALRDETVIGNLRPAVRQSLEAFVALIVRLRESARESAVDELLRQLIHEIQYEALLRAEGAEGIDRLENVRELIAGAAEVVADELGEVGLTPLDHFLQQATLMAGTDLLDPSADAVTLMTMHNAKGLEYPVVFVTGLEDGLFPLARASDSPSALEEERRLFYVGVTRAERTLLLTWAEQRRRNGEMLASRASRFLAEIPEHLLKRSETRRVLLEGRARQDTSDWHDERPSWRAPVGRSGSSPYRSGRPASRPVSGRGGGGSGRGTHGVWGDTEFGDTAGGAFADAVDAEEQSQDAPEYRVGERVRHPKFGAGVIAELAGSGRDAKVRIDFDDEEIGRKTLVIAQAKLERGWE